MAGVMANNDGIVAFQASLQEGGSGAYVTDGATITVIAESGGGLLGEVCSHPDINHNGSSCFCASLRAGGSGVFVAYEGEIATIVDTSSSFESFRGVLLDGAGRIVFYATPRGGTLGVFSGHDPIADCLLSLGSPLFGSTVAEFVLNPVSINDAGQIAIRVTLTDRRQFILRSDPPEAA